MAATLTARSSLVFAPAADPPPVLRSTLSSAEEHLGADLIFSTALLDQVAPRQLGPVVHPQTIALSVTADAAGGPVTMHAQDVVSASWTDDREGATWEVQVPADSLTALDEPQKGPLGTEQDWGGPPIAPGRVSVRLAFELYDDGPTPAAWPWVDFHVLADGLPSDSTRGLFLRRVLALSGPGWWGRYDRRIGSLDLEPGHGLTQGEVIRELLRVAGVPEDSLPPDFGEPLTNALTVTCDPTWPVAVEAADAWGLFLRPTLTSPPRIELVPLVPPLDATPVRTFTAADFVDGEVTLTDDTGDAWGTYVVRGSRSELPGDAGDGSVTEEVWVETWGDFYVIPRAYWKQVPAGVNVGDLTPEAGPGPPSRQLVSRVTTRTTKVAGCVVTEEVITETWGAPEAARYRDEVEGPSPQTRDYFPVYIYEAGAVRDDSSAAYTVPSFYFREESRVRTDYFREELRSTANRPIWTQAQLSLHEASDYLPGELRGISVATSAWYNRSEAVRIGADGAAGRKVGAYLTGGGRGVENRQEVYFEGPQDPTIIPLVPVTVRERAIYYYSVTRTVFGADGNGYKVQELEVEKTLGVDGGSAWFFSDERQSRYQVEQGLVTATRLTSYAVTDEQEHMRVSTERDVNGRLVPEGEVREKVRDYLPRMDVCTPEDALRNSNRPVSGVAQCRAGTGEAPWEMESQFIETAEMASNRALVECIRAHAQKVDGTILVDPRLRPGDPVVVDLPRSFIFGRRGWMGTISGDLPERSRGGLPRRILAQIAIYLDPRSG